MTKREFYLTPQVARFRGTEIIIRDRTEEHPAHINVYVPGVGEIGYIKGSDLERFAVNILKALNSKKLASYTDWKPIPAKRKKLKP